MSHKPRKLFLFAAFAMLPCAATILASTTVSPVGLWPNSWPEQLNFLRQRARTFQVRCGAQQNVYQIPFANREEFERAWPYLLSLKSRGAPIYVQDGPARYDYDSFGPMVQAGVLVLGPVDEGPLGPILPDGSILRSGPPWPDCIKTADGGLPEYLTEQGGKWIAYTNQADHIMIQYRARVDIVLVCDGKIVDTNRVSFPQDSPLRSARFMRKP